MRRYWLKQIEWDNDLLCIQGEDFHHIFEVCRFQKGECFELLGLNPNQAYQVRVVRFERKRAWVQILGQRPVPSLARPYIGLGLAVPKWPTLDAIVEKMVEMGILQIQLLISRHSYIHDPKDFSQGRLERIQKIIQGATQQTGRGDLMVIYPPMKLSDHIHDINPTHQSAGLIAYENIIPKRPLKHTLLGQRDRLKNAEIIWLYIGSEGGWDSEEIAAFANRGVTPFSLGEQVLRVETACVAAVASLKYELELL